MIKFSTKIKKLNNLATACANAESNDFKALWYHKLIDLAKEYNMLDYVMRKVIHWRMTVTDKDAKEWQKMVDKLEKQNKKDIEKFRKKEASIGSFFKSCLSADEKKKLDKPKKKWYSSSMKKFIDPKNPNTVGKSVWNLGNHILVVCFILSLLFVVKASYS